MIGGMLLWSYLSDYVLSTVTLGIHFEQKEIETSYFGMYIFIIDNHSDDIKVNELVTFMLKQLFFPDFLAARGIVFLKRLIYWHFISKLYITCIDKFFTSLVFLSNMLNCWFD